MAIVKANYVKRGQGDRGRAKATIRYIQHRRGHDGATVTRQLFGSDGAMDRYDAYDMIETAKKGSLFYRFILSPDPKREDKSHDLDMREITLKTMQALEQRVHQPVLWVGAIHADHAPHLHAHVIAIVPKRLYVKDFELLRHTATQASLAQRRWLDLSLGHKRERPYQLGSFAKYPTRTTDRETRHVPRATLPAPLHTCTCPRCEAVHVHHVRDPVHQCISCGLLLHRGKQISLQRKEAAWER